MLIFTLYTEDGEDHYKVQAVVQPEKGETELVDVTSEYSVLPMQITDQDSGDVLQGFFFGHDHDVDSEEPKKELEKLPAADDVNWED
jgi:hypothetical protein